MKRNKKQTKLIAFLIMLSLVITWLSLLHVFYTMGTPLSLKIFSLLLLATPVIIILIDRPTIFIDLANALLDTISIVFMKIFEWIDKYIRDKDIPKHARRLIKKERKE